jgi:ribosome-binding protein aMBF1 (putative translation factor)
MSLRKTCDICSSENKVKTTKVGMNVCLNCVGPIRAAHEVFQGQVVKHRRDEDNDR